jgi:hypothetical protein
VEENRRIKRTQTSVEYREPKTMEKRDVMKEWKKTEEKKQKISQAMRRHT